MKVAILTLPLHGNYGGNLQTWALMTTLKDMGHDAWLIDIARDRLVPWRVPLVLAKQILLKYVLRRPDISIGKGIFDRRHRAYQEIHARQFISDHISPRTEIFASTGQLRSHIHRYEFDAIVVGSDQVWRPQYTPNIEDYFLGFLDQDRKIKRLAYAASFGTSAWQFTPKQTRRCSALLRKFDAISVREDSAVTLCKDKLNAEAKHVLDPTLLLEAERYLLLLSDDSPASEKSPGKLFVYVLDNELAKQKILDSVVRRTGFFPFSISGSAGIENAHSMAVAPPVESWIRGFRDASFVFTDSFHGCVFSILFRKPFIVYGNPKRGLARFESLLDMLKLRHRLVHDADAVDDVLNQSPIDWQEVHDILDIERKKASEFLVNAIRG